MNLYEINAEILKVIDFETGEILDEEKLNALEIAKEEKIENTLLFIKNLASDVTAIRSEIEVLTERKRAKEAKIERLKQYVSEALAGGAFESARVKASFRKSEVLEISNVAVIPAEYLKFKDPEINKADLKKAVKAGLELEGVQIVEKQNLQIK